MAGILLGLKNLGLGKLEDAKIYEEEKKETKKDSGSGEGAPQVLEEKDLIYDRLFTCPICDYKFNAKVMKTGKSKVLSMDVDLRVKYEGIDSVKYDVQVCPECGYAALTSYFVPLLSSQTKYVKENICNQVKINMPQGETYTYEEAIERYQLALACAIVKRAKNSEKAYVCLRYAWLLRGYAEFLEERKELPEGKRDELKEQEMECIQNALEGFKSARKKETLPICGMDEHGVDYMIAALAYETKDYSTATRMLSSIMTASGANARMKNKARTLRDLIMEKKQEGK